MIVRITQLNELLDGERKKGREEMEAMEAKKESARKRSHFCRPLFSFSS